MPHGVRHPGGETDRQSPCRGRAARILARTIRMPPVSSIWIPGPRWAPALGHPTVRNPVGGHARERHGGAGRRGPDHQSAGGYGCPGASVLDLGITLSDERGEGERAHCRRSGRVCQAAPARLRALVIGRSAPEVSYHGRLVRWLVADLRAEIASRVLGQLVNGSSMWLKSQVFWVMPEQVLLSTVPGQPPLSRWIAQIDRKFMLLDWAKWSIVVASGS